MTSIEPGRKFISLTNHLAFHVQFSGTTRGFRGVHKFISNERFRQNATEIQPCRYSVDAAEGNIFSPQYPHFYPSNANCTYFFPVRKSRKILLKLEFLDFRPLSCSTDYIDIYQMHPKIHLDKLCYDSMPPYSLSSKNGFIVEFHSGSNERSKNRGFHFWFKYVREDEATQAVPLAHSASHAQIDSKSLCPVRITSPSMSSGTDAVISAEKGIINSSLYSVPDEPFKCQFIFMGSGSERVHVAFLQFNLFARTIQTENTTMRCDEVDHVTAHVLIGTRMSRVDDFCGSETPPQLMSTKNLMTLEYVVRSTEALRQMTSSKEPFGFVIQYEFRTDLGLSGMNAERSRNHLCYYIFNSSRQASGNIFSPNHPGYYPRNIDCHYIFHGSEKQVVVIHFEYFDVEGFSTCDDSTHSDYVLFSNYQTHDRTNRRYCGQLRPQHSIISESNYFRMMFKSNDIFDATGFYAHYQFITQQTSQINRVKITSAAESNSKYIVLIAIIVTLYALNEQSRHML